jgi:L-threonylcarbamoyladenylate synthase
VNVYRVDGVVPPPVLAAAAACIAGGGTLIFPTDTVYGIGCAPDEAAAVAAVYAAKRRPPDKPLSIHVADGRDVCEFATFLSPGARAAMRHFWPGAVSVIVERRPSRCAAAAHRGQTIAIRYPDDPVCRAIIRSTGPLAATSANLSGEAAFAGTDDDLASLPDATMAVIAGPTRRLRESTVLDCSGERVRLVRRGAVEPTIIVASLAGVAPVDL